MTDFLGYVKDTVGHRHEDGQQCWRTDRGFWVRDGEGIGYDARCRRRHGEDDGDPSVDWWRKIVEAGPKFRDVVKPPPSKWAAALDGVLGQVSSTMHERHQKYGPGNIAEHGMTGIKVRLGDKYARLKAGGLDYEDESLRDTFLDLIGYAIIGIMWLDKTWPGSEDK